MIILAKYSICQKLFKLRQNSLQPNWSQLNDIR